MKTYFNPGCALSLYKPEFEDKILDFLNAHYKERYGTIEMHKICCHHDPQLEEGSLIIVVCSGCDRRFRSLYEGISTITLWELIEPLDDFHYPDYQGLQMSIHDACPVRKRPAVHEAVRSLLHKMNIEIVEAEYHSAKSKCCGDDFYDKIPIEKVHAKMKERADEMPCEDVCVYCVSCVKAMYIGGKTPRHLLDLLFEEETDPQIYDTEKWHEILQAYIEKH